MPIFSRFGLRFTIGKFYCDNGKVISYSVVHSFFEFSK